MKKIFMIWIGIILLCSVVQGNSLSLTDPVKTIEGSKVVVSDQSKEIYSVELVSNTDQCLFNDCEAVYEVCNRDSKEIPLTYLDFNFYDTKDDPKNFGYGIYEETKVLRSKQKKVKVPCKELMHVFDRSEDVGNETINIFDYKLIDSMCEDGFTDVEYYETIRTPFIKGLLGAGECKRIIITGNLNIGHSIDHVLDYEGVEFKTWEWWNNSWKTRQNITLEITENARTNYQVQVVFNYSLYTSVYDMNTDGEDVRFTDINSNILHYWLEAYDDTVNNVTQNDTLVFWVNVTDLPVGNNTIIAYWNNSLATTTQSGNDTFIFYHDFEHILVEGVEFDMGGSPSLHPNTRDGYLLTNNTGGTIETLQRFDGNISMQWRFTLDSEATHGFNAGGLRLSSPNSAVIVDHPSNNNDYFYVNGFDNGIPPVDSHQNMPMEYTIYFNQSNYPTANFSYYRGGTWKYGNRSSFTLLQHPLEWGMRPDGLYTGEAHDGKTYWVFVRNYISPTPRISYGIVETAEEVIPPNEVPVTYNTTIDPQLAYENYTLNCSALALDDQEQINMTFNWSLNNDPQSYSSVRYTYNNTLTHAGLLFSNVTNEGDNVTCIVTTNDGIEISDANNDTVQVLQIPNEVPIMQVVNLNPASPLRNESVNCSGQANDDQDQINFTFVWFLNDDPQSYDSTVFGYNDTPIWASVLFSNTTEEGDVVTCRVTANDGINVSLALNNSVVVVAVDPDVTAPTLSEFLPNTLERVFLLFLFVFVWLAMIMVGWVFRNPVFMGAGFLVGVLTGFMFVNVHWGFTLIIVIINGFMLFVVGLGGEV